VLLFRTSMAITTQSVLLGILRRNLRNKGQLFQFLIAQPRR